MRQDLSFEVWRNKILSELDTMQRELREKMAPRAENPVRNPSVVQPVRSVQMPSQKPVQQKNRTPVGADLKKQREKRVKSSAVTKTVKTRAVSVGVPIQAPPIVKTRSPSFWQEKNASTLPAYSKRSQVDHARQSRAAQTVEAYSKLSPEERLERAAQMKADYEAECQRLGM